MGNVRSDRSFAAVTLPASHTSFRSQTQRLVLEPPGRFVLPSAIEIWQFRDLLLTLAARDLKVRYKQTALGAGWILLQPLLGAGILTFVFAKVAGLEAPGGTPYFLLSFAGMVVWTAFSSTLSRTSSALIGNASLVSKVYFPRLILPLSTLFSTLVDVAVMMVLLVILCAMYGVGIPAAILLTPLLVLVSMILASGVGTFLAGLAVKYRDVQYLLPVITQLLLLASPVAYSAARAGKYRGLYFLNPLAGLIEAFRGCVLGSGAATASNVAYAVLISIAAALLGWIAFARMDRNFADVI
jgi:lipopolysaccharide transport system permease protein